MLPSMHISSISLCNDKALVVSSNSNTKYFTVLWCNCIIHFSVDCDCGRRSRWWHTGIAEKGSFIVPSQQSVDSVRHQQVHLPGHQAQITDQLTEERWTGHCICLPEFYLFIACDIWRRTWKACLARKHVVPHGRNGVHALFKLSVECMQVF